MFDCYIVLLLYSTYNHDIMYKSLTKTPTIESKTSVLTLLLNGVLTSLLNGLLLSTLLLDTVILRN